MIQTTLSFEERYDELRDLGVPDWQIAKRLGISIESLARMLCRAGRPLDPLLSEMVAEQKRAP